MPGNGDEARAPPPRAAEGGGAMPGENHRERRDGWDGCASERGQTMAEYTVVAAVVLITCVAAYTAFGQPIAALIQNVADVVGNLV
jgi:Flp pilus assembly pilin Flp